jgi:hypothetical protein
MSDRSRIISHMRHGAPRRVAAAWIYRKTAPQGGPADGNRCLLPGPETRLKPVKDQNGFARSPYKPRFGLGMG